MFNLDFELSVGCFVYGSCPPSPLEGRVAKLAVRLSDAGEGVIFMVYKSTPALNLSPQGGREAREPQIQSEYCP